MLGSTLADWTTAAFAFGLGLASTGSRPAHALQCFDDYEAWGLERVTEGLDPSIWPESTAIVASIEGTAVLHPGDLGACVRLEAMP